MYIDIITANITFIRCCHKTKLSKSDAVANYYVIIILISIYLNRYRPPQSIQDSINGYNHSIIVIVLFLKYSFFIFSITFTINHDCKLAHIIILCLIIIIVIQHFFTLNRNKKSILIS